jgi:hypothetical protein
MINRAENLVDSETVHHGAGPVINGFATDQHVVGIHDAMNEAESLPCRNQRSSSLHDLLKQC